jgi:hypothetical protein
MAGDKGVDAKCAKNGKKGAKKSGVGENRIPPETVGRKVRGSR